MSDIDTMMREGAHPSSWEDFVGQEKAKAQLRVKAAAARMSGQVMGHIMLYSPEPGIGKTSLAMLIAKEAGRDIHVVSGQLSADEARYHFSRMSDGDVLLWDEMHQAFEGARKKWEWMLHYFQHGHLLTPMGPEQHAKVTVIGATTDMGKTPETVDQRLEMKVRLQPYTESEQMRICGALAGKIVRSEVDAPIADSVGAAIARASNGKPRIMQRMWKHVRDLLRVGVIVPEVNEAGHLEFDLTTVLEWEGVRPDGLSELGVQYLLFCYVDNQMRPVGFDRIVERLREDPKAVAATEQLLMDKGFITQTTGGRAGRTLTTEGMKRAKELAQEQKGAAA